MNFIGSCGIVIRIFGTSALDMAWNRSAGAGNAWWIGATRENDLNPSRHTPSSGIGKIDGEKRHRLEQILHSITDGYYALDSQWRFVALNGNAEKHFGKPEAELIGRNIWRVTSTPTHSDIYRNFHEAREKARARHFEACSRIRPGYWAEMHLYPHEDILEVYFTDISRRKQTEAALRESEDRFRKIFEHAALGISIIDTNGYFQQNNPAYCDLVGYSASELRRMTYDALIHPDDQKENIRQVSRVTSGELPFFEITNRYIHKSGRPVWVQKFISAMPDGSGKPMQLMALVTDISENLRDKELLSQLNEALVERTHTAEKRAADIQRLAMELSKAEEHERRRIAATLHDDLQQMLAYLKIKLTSPGIVGEKNREISNACDIIDQCIERCRNLAHELTLPQTRRNDLAGALQWLCQLMKQIYGMEISLTCGAVPEMKSSVLTAILIRCARELLFNVFKHSGKKSAVIETRFEQDTIILTVRDDGEGCDAEKLKRRRKEDAAFGLGSIEDRMHFIGGSMEILSEPGTGFLVRLSVPMAVAPASREANAAPGGGAGDDIAAPRPDTTDADGGAKRAIRVMIADDHELMREGLANLLREQEGFDVVGMAANGSQAVHLSLEATPDVILMDVSMPVMNGIDATAEIHRLMPDVNIVGLTMHTDEDVVNAMLSAGARICLSKVASPEELVSKLKQFR